MQSSSLALASDVQEDPDEAIVKALSCLAPSVNDGLSPAAAAAAAEAEAQLAAAAAAAAGVEQVGGKDARGAGVGSTAVGGRQAMGARTGAGGAAGAGAAAALRWAAEGQEAREEGREEDILGRLIGVFGSAELFITEYRCGGKVVPW